MSPRFIVFHRRVLVGWSCALLILAALWWLLSTDLVRPAIAPTEAVSGKLVVIDPGHGGPDPGAVGVGGTLEKEIVLAIAELLEPMLRRAAVYTLRLREGDYDLVERHGAGGFGSRKRDDLMLRAQAANDAGADLFLSLHANSFPSPRWSGAQTFYDPSDPASRRLAEALQHRLREAVPQNTRLARPGDYLVLKETQMPAVVVELGFLSNPDEERLLNSEAYRQNLARAIFHGIVDYLIGEAQPGEAPEAGVAPTSAEGFPPVEESELPPGGFHLYFHSSENERDGLEALGETFPSSLLTEPIERRIAYALGRLAAGPPEGIGLGPVMPPGAKVLDVTVAGETVAINLSREVRTRFWGGGRSEDLLIESVARTVGQFHGIGRVVISVEGDVWQTLAGHIDISEPFEVIGPARVH